MVLFVCAGVCVVIAGLEQASGGREALGWLGLALLTTVCAWRIGQ